MSTNQQRASQCDFERPRGGGEAGERLRAFNWAATAVGPREHWSVEQLTAAELVLASSPAAVLIWGESDTVSAYNDAYLPILQNRPDPMGRSFIEFWPENRAYHLETLAEVRTGKSIYEERYPFEISPGDLRYYTFSFNPVLNADGDVGGIILNIADVTEFARTRAALADREARMRTLVGLSTQATWETRPDGYLTDISDSWCDMTGQQLDEAVGHGWARAVHPLHRERAGENWRRAVATSTELDSEYLMGSDELGWLWTRARARPVRDANGAILFWLGLNVDIDHLKRAELGFEQALRQKEEFLATLSHELRNPLAAILSGLNMLELGFSASPDSVANTQHRMRRQVEHLVRLVDDLLDISRVTGGHLNLSFKELDLVEVIASAMDDTRYLVDRNKTHFLSDLPDQPLPVQGDAVRLNQVITNIIHNAVKYSGEAGNVELRAFRNGHHAVVTLRDDGAGMDDVALAMAFQMFGKSDTPAAESGLGVGLALARSLVKQHGGDIDAYSAGPGQGSTFTLRLPLCEPGEEAAESEGSLADQADQTPSRPLEVLLVEDDPDVAQAMAGVLELLEQRVRVASTGATALRLFQESRPELVLMDIGLPDRSGVEVARSMRDLPGGDKVFIAALTGWGNVPTRLGADIDWIDRRLTKPLDIGELEALIHHLVVSGQPQTDQP